MVFFIFKLIFLIFSFNFIFEKRICIRWNLFVSRFCKIWLLRNLVIYFVFWIGIWKILCKFRFYVIRISRYLYVFRFYFLYVFFDVKIWVIFIWEAVLFLVVYFIRRFCVVWKIIIYIFFIKFCFGEIMFRFFSVFFFRKVFIGFLI